MTPAARISAAIDCLDRVFAGAPAEKVLTNWARASRFAGSKDRAAVRDLVFSGLRCKRSFAALGGAETGRGVMIGGVRAGGEDPAVLFSGEGHAPAPLTASEARIAVRLSDLPDPVRYDYPDWLDGPMRDALGADLAGAMTLMQARAPLHLRVNARRASRDRARDMLAGEGIETRPHPLADTALEVVGPARGLKTTAAFRDGLVELQDAASQAVVADIAAIGAFPRILDACAGGGGKALALAAHQPKARVVASDASPARMRDIPERARRAGARIEVARTETLDAVPPFDLVLCDVPCSGSGAWRRQPEAKWRLSDAALAELLRRQAEILDRHAAMVAPGGVLALVTCSLLRPENEDQAAGFLARHDDFRPLGSRRLSPSDGGDGFFVATFAR